eukprot:4992908-Pyramimonas_sp.AAC.1
MGGGTHADPVAGAFGGALFWATILVRGVPKWAGGRMRTLPLELPTGPRNVVLGVRDACGR